MVDKFNINVALPKGKGWNGEPTYQHYFNIEVRELNCPMARERVAKITREMKQLYPDARITVIYWQCRGQEVDV